MLRSRSLSFVIGCAMLASCGGDSGSGSSSGGGGGGGGGNGGGSGTPAPTYQTFAQLTGTQTFRTTCGGFYFEGGRPPMQTGGLAFGSGITIVSDRSQPSYDITTDGTGLFGTFATSFSQADRDTSVTAEAYKKVAPSGFTERFAIFPVTQNGAELEHLRIAQVIAENFQGYTSQICALGVPTIVTDVPAASVTYGGIAVFGNAYVVENAGAGPISNYRITNSTTTLRANPANGQIDFTLALKGQLVTQGTASTTITDLGSFTGTTTFDGSDPGYNDIVIDSQNTVAGTFGGGFFGPQGKTAAVSVGLQTRRADDSDLVLGALLILRPQ
ncbi:hypothetical protein [Citromicrobium bathyomarinum]|uniref:hypothetical protein n=1 Tax=Citromicrobium bathyomarinum TaxID=72174 RepID=UPI003159BEB6